MGKFNLFPRKSFDMDSYYSTEEELGMKHIWGVTSNSEVTGLYTMNDFDITYYRKERYYKIGIETIYLFKNKEEEIQYLKNILSMLTGWMNIKNYDTSYKLSLYDIFTDGISIASNFDSLEKLYATFKFIVNAYELDGVA